MAEPLTINVTRAATPTPKAYTVPGSTEVEPLAAFASFDGSAAASPFLPSLAFYSAAGILISRTFPASAVAAGGSADVSYFPGLGGGGASGGGNREIELPLDAPDANANGFIAWGPNYGFANLRALVPAFATSLDGSWEGRIRIPGDYQASGTILLAFVANDVIGDARIRVSTSVVNDGDSEDTAYTAEAYQAVTVNATALDRFTATFVLSTALAAGATLNYRIDRNGTNAADTLLVDILLWHAALTYVAA